MSKGTTRGPIRQKRQPSEASPLLEDESKLPPRIELHSAAFYDSVSKLWLTRRALKELERRTNNQASSPQHPTSTPQRVIPSRSNVVQRFARAGGPDLRDLRGYPEPTNEKRAMSSSHASGSGQTNTKVPESRSTSKRISAYDRVFEQHLNDHGIYLEGHDYGDERTTPEPELDVLHEMLRQPRASLSLSAWSNSDFQDFRQRNRRVIEEGDVMREVIPIICGNTDILSRQNLLFTELDPIASGVTVAAKPDFFDGARLNDIDKQVQEDIGDYIIPTKHALAPVAPNFFLEVKRPSGDLDVAKRQACYDGALGARGMHQLQCYGQDQLVYDGNACALTATYQNGNLNIYATHVTSSGPRGAPRYHMSHVDGWNLVGNPGTSWQGLAAFRNGRDWAREQRDAFIAAANEMARSLDAEQSSETSSHSDISDSADVEDDIHLTQAEDADGDPRADITEAQRAGESELSIGSDRARYIQESSISNDPSDTHHTESEDSPDELALDMHPAHVITKKRPNKWLEKTVSKSPRYSDD